MTRPSFEEVYMRMAHLVALRSSCARLRVGCVIASADYRRATAGYNGGASGQDNDCASLEPGKCGHLHAEENAIINCAGLGMAREVEKVVFLTDLPCVMCAKRLINLGGVSRVLYERPYRDESAIAVLQAAGIAVVRYKAEGRWRDDAEESPLVEDRCRALKLAHELTEETQTCEEAVADLSRQLRETREGYGRLDANWAAVHEAAVGALRAALDMPGATVPELVAEIVRLRGLERAGGHHASCRCAACHAAGRWQD